MRFRQPCRFFFLKPEKKISFFAEKSLETSSGHLEPNFDHSAGKFLLKVQKLLGQILIFLKKTKGFSRNFAVKLCLDRNIPKF